MLHLLLKSIKLNKLMQKISLTDISRFDFNLAVTFLALWEERSVTRAAQRLSLSQPAVSTALTHFAAVPPFLQGMAAVSTIPVHAARALAQVTPLAVCPPPLALERYPVSLVWKRTNDNPWLRQVLVDAVGEVLLQAACEA